ncbi:MAG: TolB family protein [Rhizomicrobium sp.]
MVLGAWKRRAGALGLAAALACIGGTAIADDIDLSKLETDDLRLLYYDPIQTYLPPYLGRAFENSFAFQRKTFHWTPWDKPTVELEDLSDDGIAYVRSTPFNGLTVEIAPSNTTFETFTPGERFFTLMNHELVHVATLDVWNDDDAFWRNLFHGKPLPVTDHPETILYNYLAQPRADVPRWYLEGSAVFMETWMGGGLGRAQGGYDEMVFRAMVRDNAHFFDPVGLVSKGDSIDFQVGANDYLYGTRFFSYLALTYGPEKVLDWLRRDKDSKAYYVNQFKYVFGKNLDDVWADWIAFEHDWQKKNLESVHKYPITPVQRLTPSPLGSISRAYYDAKTDSLITGIRPTGVIASISAVSLKDGSVRRIVNLKGPSLYVITSLAFDPATEKAYYTTDNYVWRDLVQVDVNTGETHVLLKDARIGDLAFDNADGSIWGVRHLNGLDTLVRVKPDFSGWNQILTFTYGQDFSDIDISPDGTLLCATVKEINGASRLDVYRISDLFAGNPTAIATLKLGQSIPEGGVFSPDGKYVYATSYYTGVSNVYRLDIATNTFDAMTNADTGFFLPVPMADGSLIAYEFAGTGFQPVRIHPKPLDDLSNVKFLGTQVADKWPEVKTWGVGSPEKVPLDSMITARGFYKPEENLLFDGSYPVIAGYKGHIAAGWHVQWEDPLLYDHFIADISYSPASDLKKGQQLHADVTWQTLFWKLTYWHNRADFYDLFGPTERSRKGDALLIGYHTIPIYDLPRQLDVTADLNLFSGLDTLPGAQNIQSNDRNIATGKVGFVYSDITKSLGAVDFEQGYRVTFEAQADYAHNQIYPKAHAGLDFGFELPWNHASLWMYNAAGATAGNRHNVLDYYFMGAFGNNYVDDREVKRYREFDSFPGFGIDDISARAFWKSTGEFNFPPIRFEDAGSESFYLSSIRSALFGGILFADPGNEGHRTLENLGFQLDFNFTVAVRLPMTLSIGDAVGFDNGRAHQNEIMVSLKIL